MSGTDLKSPVNPESTRSAGDVLPWECIFLLKAFPGWPPPSKGNSCVHIRQSTFSIQHSVCLTFWKYNNGLQITGYISSVYNRHPYHMSTFNHITDIN